MNTTVFSHLRRRLLLTVMVALLALIAFAAPVVVDKLAGTALVQQAFACPGAGGGC